MNWPLMCGAIAFVLLSVYTIRGFGSLLNPIYVTFAIEFFLRTLLGYVVYSYVFPMADPELLDEVLWLSILYAGTFYLGVRVRNGAFERLAGRLASLSIRSSDPHARVVGGRAAALVFVLGGALFACLAVLGGGGALWITNTREAYLTYRSGVGVFWSGFACAIPLSLLLFLHLRRGAGRLGLLVVVSTYLAAAYFTGSKQTILSVVLCLLFYRHYYVRPFSTVRISVMLVGMAVAFFATTVLQGSFASMFESLSYFDYIKQTTVYLQRKSELWEVQGSGITSYLWSFVPRALVPDKPFEYGPVLISSYLFPGAAEDGYTPAYLEWATAHLDFGVVGVALLGLLKGQFVSAFFRAFLQDKENFFLFVFTCHLGFMVFNFPGVFELALAVSLFVGWVLKRLSSQSVAVSSDCAPSSR